MVAPALVPNEADVELVATALLTPILLFGQWYILLLDRRRIIAKNPAIALRGWNEATLGSAVYLLGPIAVALHVAITRRGFGRLWGLAAGVGAYLGTVVCSVAAEAIAGALLAP